jgi:hypothetical protein
MRSLPLVFGILFLWFSSGALATEERGPAVVVRVEGDVRLFVEPSETAPEGSAQNHERIVKFKDLFFKDRVAKRGTRVYGGEVIKTGANSKARLIFKNGDQMTLQENSAYRLSATKAAHPIVELFFGDLRSIIKPGGAGANTEVKTSTTVMGVRGTDFHVKAWSKKGGSEVSVLRGKVAVASLGATESTPMTDVVAGQTAVVGAAPAANAATSSKTAETPAPIQLRPTTQQELVAIQKNSVVSPSKTKDTSAENQQLEKDVEALEQKAVENVLGELKVDDPEVYRRIMAAEKGDGKTEAAIDIDAVNSVSVGKLLESAPPAPGQPKLEKKDLKLNDQDVYDRFKWNK